MKDFSQPPLFGFEREMQFLVPLQVEGPRPSMEEPPAKEDEGDWAGGGEAGGRRGEEGEGKRGRERKPVAQRQEMVIGTLALLC